MKISIYKTVVTWFVCLFIWKYYACQTEREDKGTANTRTQNAQLLVKYKARRVCMLAHNVVTIATTNITTTSIDATSREADRNTWKFDYPMKVQRSKKKNNNKKTT